LGSNLVAHMFKQKVLNFCENSHMGKQSNFWFVTHYVSLNVCAVVDMHGLFTYVGAEMAGSCHDMRVLDECMQQRKFPTPPKDTTVQQCVCMYILNCGELVEIIL
jgi:hypothetical protein